MSDAFTLLLTQAEQFFRSGDVGRAESLLRQILAANPRHPKAAEFLGYIAGNRGEMDHSFELLKIATIAPDSGGEAHYYLGKHYLARGQFDAAAQSFRQALTRIGDFFEGLHDLGVALSGHGESRAAIAAYDRALAFNPSMAQLHYNKGVAFDALKQFDDALMAYDKAIALDPNLAVAWSNRGATLNDVCRYHDALASHEKAIALDPTSAQSWSNRGATLTALKRYEEALQCHEKALALQPAFAEAWARAGAVFNEMKSRDRACDHMDKALSINPGLPFVQGDRLHSAMLLCRWHNAASGRTLEQEWQHALDNIDAARPIMTPFVVLSLPATRAQQRQCSARYAQDRYFTPDNPFAGVAPAKRSKIKLGYFSPDFRTHAVSFLTAGLFEQHDRARFELHAFSLRPGEHDPLTTRLQSAFEQFHEVGHLSDVQIVEHTRKLGIDIAIDLAGHTEGARTGPFARRVAPLQVNYLGYPGGMGVPYIDYLIGDDIVVPESHRADYAEKIVVMPHCFQVNDDRRAIGPTPTRAQHALPESALVFCCFNNIYKLNPRIFDVWLDVLRQVPHAVLWLVRDNDEQVRNLRQWSETRGVAAERLVFAERLPYAEHLARYQLADLVLDTLPFNGGTTTSDALWGGAPVLTCAGETFAGRMASSLLHAVGLPELAVGTLDDYRQMALQLAQQPQRVAQLKATLAGNRQTHPLFDTKLFARHIEHAYEQMWQRHCSGLPPDHLTIAPLGNDP